MNSLENKFLNQYLMSLPASKREQYSSFSSGCFCADEFDANICAELVLAGVKTATCSLKYAYEYEAEPLPSIGHLHVLTNWSGLPLAVIETTSVEECPFGEVTESFAEAEGEGDRSLDWWRKAHWKFFGDQCREMGVSPGEEMLLVLQRFKRVY